MGSYLYGGENFLHSLTHLQPDTDFMSHKYSISDEEITAALKTRIVLALNFGDQSLTL